MAVGLKFEIQMGLEMNTRQGLKGVLVFPALGQPLLRTDTYELSYLRIDVLNWKIVATVPPPS